MIKTLRYLGALFVCGIAVMAGMRFAEWLIPKPETRLIVCFGNEEGKIGACKSAELLLRRAGESQ